MFPLMSEGSGPTTVGMSALTLGAGDRLQLFFINKFSPNSLIGRIGKDRTPAKQSLLRWPCPPPSDRAIPGLWQNLESKV